MLTSRLICVPVTMVSIAVLLRLCAGSIFPSVAVGEGLGQLSSLPQVTKGEWGERLLVLTHLLFSAINYQSQINALSSLSVNINHAFQVHIEMKRLGQEMK